MLVMFDAKLGAPVYVIAPVVCIPCDNICTSELLSHLGSKAKKLWVFCMVSVSLYTWTRAYVTASIVSAGYYTPNTIIYAYRLILVMPL